ncbi:hypothetical protein [Sphingobacterium chuzhouense]|uniref:Uncharacterized protein n=1 Tax=Sphingobacterium chuzhouense TaxID=1742264 RepID=A0ABR7XTS0_9SPHI|nr:hypothetical protein [Sphingobacterium chuzhouense]MBD1422570.1 hypothetical protein [Sphingobacterium chuzhouense]
MRTQIKNLVKSALFGVAVLGGGLAANAWTGEKQADGHLVNKGDGLFELRSSVNPMDCQPTEPTPCNYQILSPENIPTQESYTAAELESFESNGWISPSSSNGVYQN